MSPVRALPFQGSSMHSSAVGERILPAETEGNKLVGIFEMKETAK